MILKALLYYMYCINHQQTGGDLLDVHEPHGRGEQLLTMFSPRTLGSIRHGGRQEIGILGNKSSVRQCSARNSPPRRSRRIRI